MQPDSFTPPVVVQPPQPIVEPIQPIQQPIQPMPQSIPQVVATPLVAPGQIVYATFWERLGATALDSLIIGVVAFVINFVIGLVLGFALASSGSSTSSPVFALVSSIISFITYGLEFLYFIFFIGAKGQTLGKMVLKIKVVKIGTNDVPGYAKAFLRETIGKFLSSLVFGLGYFAVIKDKNKQAWHDKIAGTVVVKV